jgi:hypothetical protein
MTREILVALVEPNGATSLQPLHGLQGISRALDGPAMPRGTTSAVIAYSTEDRWTLGRPNRVATLVMHTMAWQPGATLRYRTGPTAGRLTGRVILAGLDDLGRPIDLPEPCCDVLYNLAAIADTDRGRYVALVASDLSQLTEWSHPR